MSFVRTRQRRGAALKTTGRLPEPKVAADVALTRIGYGHWFMWLDKAAEEFAYRECEHHVPIMKCCKACDYQLEKLHAKRYKLRERRRLGIC